MLCCKNFETEKVMYYVNDRVISLDRDLRDRYNSLVCPIDEDFLKKIISIFNKEPNDAILSREIELDMAKTLDEYGFG